MTAVLHVSGTGWHGIADTPSWGPEEIAPTPNGKGMTVRSLVLSLPAWVSAALEPCDWCDGHGNRYFPAHPPRTLRCPRCHEGRPTITVTVPCPHPSLSNFGYCPDCDLYGRVERRAVIEEVLPVLGVDSPWPYTDDDDFSCLIVGDDGNVALWVHGAFHGNIDLADAANFIGHHAALFKVVDLVV